MLRKLSFVISLGSSVCEFECRAGPSAFDTLVSKNGGIPYPFSQFAEWQKKNLNEYAATNIPGVKRKVSEVSRYFPPPFYLIPDGRSLQKDKADFHDPRILTVLTTDGGGGKRIDADRYVFVGYAPNAEQLEVISWNPQDNRWEFQIVKDYAPGKTPVVETPSRALCMTCHQAGAPIFAGAPWKETAVGKSFLTTFGPRTDELLRKIQKTRGLKESYQGLSPETVDMMSVLDASTIDTITRQANQFLQAKQACTHACKEDVACRQYVLTAALFSRLKSSLTTPFDDGIDYDEFKKRRLMGFAETESRIEKTWPEDGFEYASSVLPDRDPLLNPERGGTAFEVKLPDMQALAAALSASRRQEEGLGLLYKEALRKNEPDLTFNEDFHAAPINSSKLLARLPERIAEQRIPFLAEDGSLADPKKPRPKIRRISKEDSVRYLTENAFMCLGLTPLDADVLESLGDAKIEKAMRSQGMQALLKKSWPPSRGAIMTTLLKSLGQKEKMPYCGADSPVGKSPLEPSKKIEIEKISSALARDQSGRPMISTLGLFQKYCAGCHSGDGAVKPLPLSQNQDALRNYRGKKGESVLKMLRERQMPPHEASQPTEEERRQMLGL